MPFRLTSSTLLAVAACVAAAAGCGSTSKANAPSPTSDRAARWHRVVLCARAHGMPNLPDPSIDVNGKAHFPPSVPDTIPVQTRNACQALFNRLLPDEQPKPPTQADIAALVQFARCMRSHGVPDWPDPNSSGQFAMPPRIAHALKSQFRTPLMACDHLNPDRQGRIYGARP
jgi:hypothetical protein